MITALYLIFMLLGIEGVVLIASVLACAIAGFLCLFAFFLNLRDELRLARMNRRASHSQPPRPSD